MPRAEPDIARASDRSAGACIVPSADLPARGGPHDRSGGVAGTPQVAELVPAAVGEQPPFCIVDLSGELRYANPAFTDLAKRFPGISPGGVPIAAAALSEIIAEIEAGAGPIVREIALAARQPGHRPAIHLRAQYAGVRDAAGRLAAIGATHTDVSDLVASQRQLLVAQERLDDVTRLASDWVWETDTNLALTYASPRIYEVLGFQPVELIGRCLLDLIHFTGGNDHGDQPLDPVRRAPFRDYEVTMAHRDGSQRLFNVSALPVFCATNGDFLGFRGTTRDVTDLKNREDALCAAKEAAEIASRSKSEFLANISHELRTPLNAIIGFSEIMRDELFGPLGNAQYREYIGDVFDSAQHLLQVINDILDIAKAEAGKLDLADDEVEIGTMVHAAIRFVHELAQRGELTIRTRLPDGLPLLHADERKLKQVLLNLLTNAVKFTPPGGSIEIACRRAENGDILLEVTDTGIGIAAENIATALAAFGQVDSKLARKYEGTGLGLPLCNAMVKLHGGSLSIDSVVGEGTTVTVRLPASRVRTASLAPANPVPGR